MTATPNLDLPYIDAAQSQKHVTHNAALAELDAIVQLSVIQRNATTPPTAPAAGDRYLLGAGAAGAWAGRDGSVATFIDGAWIFATPKTGWRCYVASENALLVFANGVWSALNGGTPTLQNVPLLGVGVTADANNPFSAKLNAALFTAKSAGEGGSGDMRVTFNKSAATNTASQLYQNNYSGRAETGLTGDDKFHVKVSPDGSTWNEALTIDQSTGVVSFPRGLAGGLVWNGVGAPTNAIGADNDFYLDIAASRLYGPKSAGAWPTNFIALGGGTAPTGGGATYHTGDQSSSITVSASAGLLAGNVEALVNGSVSQQTLYFTNTALTSAAWIQFDFGSPKTIVEATYTQQNAMSQGTWQWQGSNDGVAWSAIGGAVTLDQPSVTMATLNANTTAYRYYRLQGVSANANSNPWVYQMQFKW